MNGLLLVDKPAGITSHGVVARLRRVSGMRRIGHAGTLDPSVTGLLVVFMGMATRLSEFLVGCGKTYEGAMRLGVETDSYDLDGDIINTLPVPDVTQADLQSLLDHFSGEIDQIPPMVSAVKVGGKRLYQLARVGQVVERAPRRIQVYSFEVLGYDPPDVGFRVSCSSGTYIRSLCHDAGGMLGCGGAMAWLRRTVQGRFNIGDAKPLDGFSTPSDIAARLIPMGDILGLPAVVIPAETRQAVTRGIRFSGPDGLAPETWVQLKDEKGELLALATVLPDGELHPRRVLATDDES